jgi:hypothetical protein
MKMAPLNVIPAKAGIHAIYRSARSWIPAFAGMTDKGWSAAYGAREPRPYKRTLFGA